MRFLSLNNLKFSLEGRAILNGVSFSMRANEKLGIIGPSGSGKSILLKIIAGIYGDFGDQLKWESGHAPSIGFLFQEGALFDSMNTLENVTFPLRNGTSAKDESVLSIEEAYAKAAEALTQVGLAAAINKQVNELSGGMRKRVGIARAIVHQPSLLLLDEPTSGLDPVTANTIMDLIDNLTAARGCATVLVSHDLRRLLPRVERTVTIEDGVVACDSLTKELQFNAPPGVLKFIKTRFDFGNAQSEKIES